MTMTRMSFLAITLIAIQSSHLSLGFSAWLPCHRSLEEDEVIMNNKVVEAPMDTDNTVVALAIYDSSGNKRLDVDSIVWIDEELAASLQSIQYTVRMDPSTIDELSDIQYVVEAQSFENDTPVAPIPPSHRAPSAAPSPDIVTAEGSKTGFVAASSGGGVLCGGKRSHTRGKTGFVTYQLNLSHIKKSGGEEFLSSMWGGWAEGHSKVTLTPRIYFKIRSSAPGDDKKDEL
eukprot:scaffold86884_cov80-Cyclotella_meneghiniana.AAC.2